MALPSKFFAPSFQHRHLSLFMSIIVGVMVYMATFVTVAEASLSATTMAWHSDLQTRLTIEIPPVDDEAAVPQAERVKQALAILRAMPGIAHAEAVKDDDAVRLLQPWISDAELLKSLPVPSLIDAERAPNSKLTAEDVRQQLKPTVRDVHVDDHAVWLQDLARFVNGVAAFGGLMMLIAAATLALSVMLVCRAVMATERETISLLHILGAEDNDIASHFQNYARRLSLRAALPAFLLALISAGALLYFMRHFADTVFLQPWHWVGLGLAVVAVPCVAIAVASGAARRSALGFLNDMP